MVNKFRNFSMKLTFSFFQYYTRLSVNVKYEDTRRDISSL